MRDEQGRLIEAWYAAALSGQLREGRPLSRVVMGEPIVLWRDVKGRPVAATDQCLHRAAILSEGAVIDGCLACPYHGWMWGPEGQLVRVPSQGSDEAPPSLSLRTWPALESDGLIWLWFGDGQPRGEPFSIPYHDDPSWDVYFMETLFDNDVTNLVENFMDVPHTVFVHDKWFRRSSLQRIPTRVERTVDAVHVTYDQPADSIGWSGRILNPRDEPLVHTDRFFMPSSTRVDYVWGERGLVISSTCTPIGPGRTRVFTAISHRLGWLRWPARVALPWYTRKVIQQDVEIMANQGRSLQRLPEARFHHTAADRIHEEIEILRDRSRTVHDPPPPRESELEFWI